MNVQPSSQSLQYVCDLLNQDASQPGERSDAVQMKCKAGKPCNGRCIPQSHQCKPTGGLRSGQAPESTAQPQQPKKGMSTGQKVALGVVGGYVGLNVAAYAGLHHLNGKIAEAEAKAKEAEASDDKAFHDHLNQDPQRKADYEKAKAYGRRTAGQEGEDYVHRNAKKNWRNQTGTPDPNAPKTGEEWHKTLGVKKNASPDEVKSAYRKLSLEHHPDKGGDAKKFEEVHEAYKASKRKDSINRWDEIERAYQSAQQHHSRVDSAFWRL